MPGVVRFLLDWVAPCVLTAASFWYSNRASYRRGFVAGQLQAAEECLTIARVVFKEAREARARRGVLRN